jgi:hypothetical protein
LLPLHCYKLFGKISQEQESKLDIEARYQFKEKDINGLDSYMTLLPRSRLEGKAIRAQEKELEAAILQKILFYNKKAFLKIPSSSMNVKDYSQGKVPVNGAMKKVVGGLMTPPPSQRIRRYAKNKGPNVLTQEVKFDRQAEIIKNEDLKDSLISRIESWKINHPQYKLVRKL